MLRSWGWHLLLRSGTGSVYSDAQGTSVGDETYQRKSYKCHNIIYNMICQYMSYICHHKITIFFNLLCKTWPVSHKHQLFSQLINSAIAWRGSWVWNVRHRRKRSAAPISRSRGQRSQRQLNMWKVASGRTSQCWYNLGKFVWKYKIMKHQRHQRSDNWVKTSCFIKDPFGGIGFLLILVECLPSKNEDLPLRKRIKVAHMVDRAPVVQTWKNAWTCVRISIYITAISFINFIICDTMWYHKKHIKTYKNHIFDIANIDSHFFWVGKAVSSWQDQRQRCQGAAAAAVIFYPLADWWQIGYSSSPWKMIKSMARMLGGIANFF